MSPWRLPVTWILREDGNGPVVTCGTGLASGAESGMVGLRCEDPDLAMWGWFALGVPIPTPVRPGSGSKGLRGSATSQPLHRGTPWIVKLSADCHPAVKRRNNNETAPHSITSSARVSIDGGTDKPNSLAALRLITR